MKNIFGGVALLLVAFSSGTMAFPPPEWTAPLEKKAVGKKERFTGVVEKVDATGNAVVVRGLMMREVKTLTFVVSSKTEIHKGAIPLRMKDVKRAMQVTVEYQKEKDRLIALTIEIPGHEAVH